MEYFDYGSYAMENTSDGIYYAFLLDYPQCCAYGDTEEEALDNLADVADDFFSEVNSVYMLENIA